MPTVESSDVSLAHFGSWPHHRVLPPTQPEELEAAMIIAKDSSSLSHPSGDIPQSCIIGANHLDRFTEQPAFQDEYGMKPSEPSVILFKNSVTEESVDVNATFPQQALPGVRKRSVPASSCRPLKRPRPSVPVTIVSPFDKENLLRKQVSMDFSSLVRQTDARQFGESQLSSKTDIDADRMATLATPPIPCVNVLLEDSDDVSVMSEG